MADSKKATATPNDMAAAMAFQNLLHDTYGEKKDSRPVGPQKPIKSPTVWASMGNYTISTPHSGPMTIHKGEEVEGYIARELLEAGADLRPIR